VTTGVVKEQVLEANRRFYDAFERLDLDAMEACWEASERAACLHPGGPWLRGWDQVAASWQAILANTSYIEFEIAEVRVEVSDPVAWVTCIERITSASAPDGRSAVAEVAATNLFLLDSSGWRLLLHHASPIIRSAPIEGGGES
jgi:ketosteroid isomerase-like protein